MSSSILPASLRNIPIPFWEWKENQIKKEGGQKRTRIWYYQEYGKYCNLVRGAVK